MNNERFEQRLLAIEYILSQIAESEYLDELKEKFDGKQGKDVVVNIIPSKDISFKTRSLLSSILDRLELTHQDRLDLEKYIIFGNGSNLLAFEELNNSINELKGKVKYLEDLLSNYNPDNPDTPVEPDVPDDPEHIDYGEQADIIAEKLFIITDVSSDDYYINSEVDYKFRTLDMIFNNIVDYEFTSMEYQKRLDEYNNILNDIIE